VGGHAGFIVNDVADNSTVAIYDTHTAAELAVHALKSAGIDLKALSIVGKDYRTEDHVVGYYSTGGRLKYWGKLGAFWGEVWGLVKGEAFFWMPGVGPILVGGPLVSSIVGVLEGSTVDGGLSALGRALHGMRIPKNSVMTYEAALKANKFILIVTGTADNAFRAEEVLRATQTLELAGHGNRADVTS
jgi:hypothetical protein